MKPLIQTPAIAGRIARRLLVNYRVNPEAVETLLPPGMRPKTVGGRAVAGICLIRLEAVRPRGWPAWIGISSENAAHRIAVEWDEDEAIRGGVFIPRRDTDRWFNRLAGGRLFPGQHHAALFQVEDTERRLAVEVRSDDGAVAIELSAEPAETPPADSVFRDMDEANAFFQTGALGWSPRRDGTALEGLELHCPVWRMEPLRVAHVRSSFFERLGADAEFDSAFLMRGLEHEWHTAGTRRFDAPVSPCV